MPHFSPPPENVDGPCCDTKPGKGRKSRFCPQKHCNWNQVRAHQVSIDQGNDKASHVSKANTLSKEVAMMVHPVTAAITLLAVTCRSRLLCFTNTAPGILRAHRYLQAMPFCQQRTECAWQFWVVLRLGSPRTVANHSSPACQKHDQQNAPNGHKHWSVDFTDQHRLGDRPGVANNKDSDHIHHTKNVCLPLDQLCWLNPLLHTLLSRVKDFGCFLMVFTMAAVCRLHLSLRTFIESWQSGLFEIQLPKYMYEGSHVTSCVCFICGLGCNRMMAERASERSEVVCSLGRK